MSETPGSDRPQDDNGRRREPYPGWSAEQPPQRGWSAPGGAGSGWTPPGDGDADDRAGGQAGDQAGDQAGGRAGGDQSGGREPGWQQPDQPSPEPDRTDRGTDHGGWGANQQWAWPAPTVKPGVIPLRPLGVGEILDGAVTTIRRNPGPMLGLSAIVAVITQFVGLAAIWLMLSDLQDLAAMPDTATADQVFDAVAGVFAGTLVIGIVSWVATVILTGILTVVVGRAVLGQRLRTAEAWPMARPRLLRLLGLTLVFALIVMAPFLATVLFSILATAGGGAGGGALAVLMVLIAIPLTVWLYVRYTLAAPALMLESTRRPDGGSRAIGIALALRRSGELVRHSWWRVFGVLLLIWLIGFIVGQVVQVPFSIPYYFVDPFDPEAVMSFGMLTLSALGGVVSTAIVAPFLAAGTALLYVDRRIRREGLDIDLARAAGVSIPGRTDQPPAP